MTCIQVLKIHFPFSVYCKTKSFISFILWTKTLLAFYNTKSKFSLPCCGYHQNIYIFMLFIFSHSCTSFFGEVKTFPLWLIYSLPYNFMQYFLPDIWYLQISTHDNLSPNVSNIHYFYYLSSVSGSLFCILIFPSLIYNVIQVFSCLFSMHNYSYSCLLKKVLWSSW